MKVVHVLRKPCSESTVAANVLRHGTGALNIDATRVNAPEGDDFTKAWDKPVSTNIGARGNLYITNGSQHTVDLTGNKPKGGRWPANLVLQHLPTCEQAGTRKVKASAPASGPSLTGASTSTARGKFNGVGSTAHHGDEDGTETVPAWNCALGCPVAGLDTQSGTTKAVMRKPTGKPIYATEGTAMVWNPNSVTDTTERGFTDEGGASRYFKQVKP